MCIRDRPFISSKLNVLLFSFKIYWKEGPINALTSGKILYPIVIGSSIFSWIKSLLFFVLLNWSSVLKSNTRTVVQVDSSFEPIVNLTEQGNWYKKQAYGVNFFH